MTDVRVAILHRGPSPADGPLTAALVEARGRQAERHAVMFRAAGAERVRVHAAPPDPRPFGARLRELLADLDARTGLVVLGSGAVPRLTPRLAARFVAAARGSDGQAALANDRYSADIIAVSRARASLDAVPDDLATDNALPRWLSEAAGIPVGVPPPADRRRLALDLDSPIDLLLLGGGPAAGLPADLARPSRRGLERIRAVTRDPRAELLVAGRTSASSLAVLERGTASRTRAFVEERGLRTAPGGQRPPVAVLGLLLERDGPDAFGRLLGRFGDAALVDTRVLLAHRCGADERAWPGAEDRFASDLLLPDRIEDPWLRAVTVSALAAPIPVVLGAHSLVGPGLPLALGLGAR